MNLGVIAAGKKLHGNMRVKLDNKVGCYNQWSHKDRAWAVNSGCTSSALVSDLILHIFILDPPFILACC